MGSPCKETYHALRALAKNKVFSSDELVHHGSFAFQSPVLF